MLLQALLVALLLVLLLAAVPAWPYSRTWGYFPSGLLGVILALAVVMVLLGT
jgi:hypothetical protein